MYTIINPWDIMIDLTSQTPKTFTQVAKDLPRMRANRPVSVNTVWRWAKVGIRGHKLESAFLGGVRCTTVEAVADFLRKINSQPTEQPAIPAARHQESVEAELKALSA